MAKPTIEGNVIGNQTVSQYRVAKNQKIDIANGHDTATLEIREKGSGPGGPPPPALCYPNGVDKPSSIAIPPDDTHSFKVCNNFSASKFEYEAQIGNYLAEDPIVIIESQNAGSFINPIVIIELAIGAGLAVAGYSFGRWHAGRKGRVSNVRP